MSEPIDRVDLLISRVVDGEAGGEDWSTLRTLASVEPSIWERLAEATRARDLLTDAVTERVRIADDVDLPEEAIEAPAIFATRVAAWSGWAVAACVAVVWATLAGVLPERGGGSTNGAMTAGLGGTAIASPEEALEAYLETGSRAGRVVDLLPTLMVETVPTEGGGAEVFYVRQILERRMVRQFWEVGADETGEPIAVPSPGIPASGGESAI